MKTTFAIFSTASLAVLAGCSSSDGIFRADDLDSVARIFAADIGDAGDALEDGETLTVRNVGAAAARLDYNTDRGGNTSLVDAPDMAIKLVGGELVLTIGGDEQVFTADDYWMSDDGKVYGYFTDDTCDGTAAEICNNLFSYSGTLEELKAIGNGYHKAIFAVTNQLVGDNQENIAAFGIIGAETKDEDMADLGSASYSGDAYIDVYPGSGWENFGNSRLRLRSDVAMDADFGAGTISGVMDNWESRAPGETEYTAGDGTVAMAETSFEGNGFEGKLVPDATWLDGSDVTFNGTYSGAFYGPHAEEAAGVISATGEFDNGANVNAIGRFSTSIDR